MNNLIAIRNQLTRTVEDLEDLLDKVQLAIDAPATSEAYTDDGRLRGVIDTYFDDKGYGFINGVAGQGRFFFHIGQVADSELSKQLGEFEIGDRFEVVFEEGALREGKPDPPALNVELV